MAEVVLFHHALGLTDGILALADDLRDAGHMVHTPDLHEGRTFAGLDEAMAYVHDVGFPAFVERGRAAVEPLGTELVYLGLSLGVLPAQSLAQTRTGARGAILLHGCVPLAEFGGGWPAGAPLQIHVKEDDPHGDVDVAREVAATVSGAELFLYPGDAHLFTDRTLEAYDADATALVLRRIRAQLAD